MRWTLSAATDLHRRNLAHQTMPIGTCLRWRTFTWGSAAPVTAARWTSAPQGGGKSRGARRHSRAHIGAGSTAFAVDDPSTRRTTRLLGGYGASWPDSLPRSRTQ